MSDDVTIHFLDEGSAVRPALGDLLVALQQYGATLKAIIVEVPGPGVGDTTEIEIEVTEVPV